MIIEIHGNLSTVGFEQLLKLVENDKIQGNDVSILCKHSEETALNIAKTEEYFSGLEDQG